MANILARRTAQTIYTRVSSTNTYRLIHSSRATQSGGWFGNLLRGSEIPENTGVPQEKAKEATKPDTHIKPKESVSTTSPQDATVNSSPAPVTTEAAAPSTPEPPVVKQKQRVKRTPLSPEAKTRRFEESLSFMGPRLGRKPQLKLPKIRKTTWIRALGVCQTEEQLRKVMELAPSWRDMGNQFDETFSEAFIRRCIRVRKPEVALEVFGNYAKYHVPLSLAGARELINATYDNQPLSFIIAITSLFDVYKLPPVAQDLPCCAMVISACLKDGSADARVVAQALVPHLKSILDKVGPQPIPQTQEKGDDMPRVWASWALKKVDGMMFKARGKQENWLRDWRLKSGHITDASQV